MAVKPGKAHAQHGLPLHSNKEWHCSLNKCRNQVLRRHNASEHFSRLQAQKFDSKAKAMQIAFNEGKLKARWGRQWGIRAFMARAFVPSTTNEIDMASALLISLIFSPMRPFFLPSFFLPSSQSTVSCIQREECSQLTQHGGKDVAEEVHVR